MSNDLSFREKLARPASMSASDRQSFVSPVDLAIEMATTFDHPVALAKILAGSGLRLAEAHAVVSKLANDRVVAVTVWCDDLDGLVERLRSWGLRVTTVPEHKAATGRVSG